MSIGKELKRMKVITVRPKEAKVHTSISFSVYVRDDNRHVQNNFDAIRPPATEFPKNQIITKRRERFHISSDGIRFHPKMIPTFVFHNLNASKNTTKFR